MNRRSFLASLGLVGGGLLLPSRPASASGPERRFLFVLARGGWDTTYVFTPSQDNPNVDCEPDAEVAEIGGLSFVDHASRPSVRAFFENWADSTAIVNGIEIRSVTHDRCRRLLLTGSSGAGSDDWPSTIAARSASDDLLLPHLVVHGPAYTAKYTDRVVRVGSNGQLRDLLDGTALAQSGVDPTLLSGDLEALADARVRARTTAWAANAGRGRASAIGAGYTNALATLDRLAALSTDLDLTPEDAGCRRDLAADAAVAFDCFSRGLSRCALVQDDGWCSNGWDTHSGNEMQATHYELLFNYLGVLMDDLATRSSVTGGRLADEVTIVVVSEMGRHPALNDTGGKDHWTYTSAMLVGAGVRGGTVVGAMDEDFRGRAVDLATGEPDDGGVSLLPGHLGATLLALADVDPAEATTAEPIRAVIA